MKSKNDSVNQVWKQFSTNSPDPIMLYCPRRFYAYDGTIENPNGLADIFRQLKIHSNPIIFDAMEWRRRARISIRPTQIDE